MCLDAKGRVLSVPPVKPAPRPAAAPERSVPTPGRTPGQWDVLRKPNTLWGAAWALLALGLTAYAYKRLYAGELADPDAMDYAQIARNIVSGHGFATGILRPLALSVVVTPQDGTTPEVSRAPLYPLVLMLSFALHGGHGGGNIVVLTSLLFFLLSAFAVYRLAATLFPAAGQPWLALLSAGLYVLGGSALGYAVAGLPVSLATLLASSLLIALHRAHETGGRAAPPVQLLAVGLLLGFCYLVQYSLLILAIPTLVYVFATRAPARAWRGVGLCVLGFLVVTLPWLVRNAVVSHGNPFFTLLMYGVMADTSEYPGASTIYRSVSPAETPFSFFFSHLPEMAVKIGRGLYYDQAHLSDAFTIWTLAPALASLLWRFGDVRINVLRSYAAISLFLIALATSLFAPSMQALAPFAPVVTVLGVGFVWDVMTQQRWQSFSQRAALWAWGSVVGVGLLGALSGHGAAALNPVQGGLNLIANPLPKSGLNAKVHTEVASGAILSDTPWEVAWRSQVPAVWLPRDNQAYEAVVSALAAQKGSPLAPTALLLTPEVSAYSADGEANAWLLLAGHPQAWDEHAQAIKDADRLPQVLQARIAQAQKQMAAGRLTMTPDQLQQQIKQAQTSLPEAIKNQKDQADQVFDDNYGSISEVLSDFVTDPRVLQATEANGAPSTLFLRRSYLKSLKAQPENGPGL